MPSATPSSRLTAPDGAAALNADAAASPVLPTAAGSAVQAAPRCISSEQLLAGAAELQIEHHGALYRLRQTATGKLILTK